MKFRGLLVPLRVLALGLLALVPLGVLALGVLALLVLGDSAGGRGAPRPTARS